MAKHEADLLRYKTQLNELEEKGFFTDAAGGKSTDIPVDPKKKFGKDCVLPKKPLSCYLFFTMDQVNKIKEKEKCTHPEAMVRCGKIWNVMTEDDKKNYTDKHNLDAIRY